MQEPFITDTSKTRCVYEQFLSFARVPLISVLFTFHPALLFSDCPTPEARAGICLCWRSSEHTVYQAIVEPVLYRLRLAIDISLSPVLPYCLDRE